MAMLIMSAITIKTMKAIVLRFMGYHISLLKIIGEPESFHWKRGIFVILLQTTFFSCSILPYRSCYGASGETPHFPS
jgi:hypothetical protein